MMVEPLPGWLVFLAVAAIVTIIVTLTFSNLDGKKKMRKIRKTNRRN